MARPHPSHPLRRAAAAVAAVIIAAALALPPAAAAPTPAPGPLEVRLRLLNDGTEPFDPSAPHPTSGGAGLDGGPLNGVVRTGDAVTYRVDWSANELPLPDIVIVLDLDPGQYWTSLPDACRTHGVQPASSLTPSQLVCNVGSNGSGGTTGSLEVAAGVSIVPNGSVLGARAKLSASGLDAVTTPTVVVMASARARANVVQSHSSVAQTQDVRHPDTGEVGRVFYFPITVEAGGDGRGAEPLDGSQPLHLIEDLAALPPSATTIDDSWALPRPDNAAVTCGPADRTTFGMPFGRPGFPTPVSSGNHNATADSGDWTCDFDADARRVAVRITGADLAPTSLPTHDSASQPLGAERKVVVAGQVAVWISDDDLVQISGRPGHGTTPEVRISWGTPARGVSGEPVDGERTDDDTVAAMFDFDSEGTLDSHYVGELGVAVGDMGWGDFTYVNPPVTFPNSPWWPFVRSQTPVENAGDGRVVAGAPFGIVLTATNPSPSQRRMAVCTQLSANQSLRNLGSYHLHDYTGVDSVLTKSPNLPAEHRLVTTGIDVERPVFAGSVIIRQEIDPYLQLWGPGDLTVDDVLVEYSTRPHDHDGDCGSSKAWSATAPSDLATVTQVRLTPRRPLEPGEQAHFYLAVTATAAPTDTRIWQTSSDIDWAPDASPPVDGPWRHLASGYDPDEWCAPPDHAPDIVYNDCLTIEAAQLELVKTVTTGTTLGLRPGDHVGFRLRGTVAGPPGGVATHATVVDELPEGVRLVGALDPRATVTGRTVTWDLGDVANGDSFELDYVVRVEPGTPDFETLLNTAEFRAGVEVGPGVTEALPPAGAAASIQVTGRTAELEVQKSTSTPVIDVGGTMEFTLHYRNSGTTDDVDAAFIDVLPHHGDGRRPPSSFTGTTALTGVEVGGSERVTVTAADPTTIHPDPSDPSNAPGGRTVWCEVRIAEVADDEAVPDVGAAGCPATLAVATAVRVVRPGVLRPGAAFEVSIDVATSGNRSLDRYTNEFTGRVANLELPVRSNPVTVRVKAPGLVNRVEAKGMTMAPTTTTTTTTPSSARADGADLSREVSTRWATPPAHLAATGGSAVGPVTTGVAAAGTGVAVLTARRRYRRRGRHRGSVSPGGTRD